MKLPITNESIAKSFCDVERMKKALEDIIARSNNGDLGTSKVNDMRKLAQEALK